MPNNRNSLKRYVQGKRAGNRHLGLSEFLGANTSNNAQRRYILNKFENSPNKNVNMMIAYVLKLNSKQLTQMFLKPKQVLYNNAKSKAKFSFSKLFKRSK